MALPGEEVVISGISGRFPECSTVAEFRDKLFAGEDLVSCDRRQQDLGSWGAPRYAAMLKNLDEFDADFFGINPAQVENIDPQARIVLETVYEAIIDSGQNPQNMRGSNTAVFVGISFSDSEQYWAHKVEEESRGRYLLGNSDALVANRISYYFDFKGPSAAVDTGCSSSLYAMEAAASCMASGRCDAALVAATNISLNPLLSSALRGAGALNLDGRCKVFDDSADGYTRAEAVVAVLLQRRRDARRLYAEVAGTRVNSDGHTDHSIMFPSARMQVALMRDAWREAGVDPRGVAYVEAHGTGTKVGDTEELRAIAEVFCDGRSSPLLVGSVKSNMGHSEAASGLCSIVKVAFAFEKREIPPNLHYERPNRCVPQLLDGQIEVVTKRTPLPGDLVAISSFGFGGSNAHLILRRPALEPADVPDRNLPMLVGVSGRNEKAVDALLDAVEKEGFDRDFVGLLHSVHDSGIPKHPCRGFMTRTQSGRVNKFVQRCSQTRRQIWFVFSGLGSQFSGMAAELMDIPAFRSTLDRCAQVAEDLDIDLRQVVCSDYEFAGASFSTTFMAIVAVQLGLYEVLRSCGVTPDRIVGHSLGEHSAAYADGCLSLRQAVLSAYHRGSASDHLRCSGGAMAVLGLSAAEAEAMAPPGVVVACDNGARHVTVSGPAAGVGRLVEAARRSGAVARELDTRGYAFHSPMVRPAVEDLAHRLRQVIPEARLRSARWLSSSVPRERWGSPEAAVCSAEYLAANYARPVLFREACAAAAEEEDAAGVLVVEVSPHALLLTALRPSLGARASAAPLMAKGCSALPAVASALGRMYSSGVPVRLAALFPSPQSSPVKSGTAMLSPLVVWDHSNKWFVPSFSNKMKSRDIFSVDITGPKYEWLKGHKVDGRILFPATGYLVIVWQSLAARRGVAQENLAVSFSDVVFHHATMLDACGGATELKVDLLESGLFEVRVAEQAAASGKVSVIEGAADSEFVRMPPGSARDGALLLDHSDVYKILRLRGYHYTGQFAGVLQVKEGVGGTVRRNGNWIPLLDTILQVVLLQHLGDSPGLHLPTKLRRVVIDPSQFKDSDEQLEVRTCAQLGVARCRGVQVSDAAVAAVARRRDARRPRVDEVAFVPLRGGPAAAVDVREAASLCVQLAAENLLAGTPSAGGGELRVAELAGGEPLLLPVVADLLAKEPLVSARLTLVADEVPEAARSALEAAGTATVRPAAAPGDHHLAIAYGDPAPAAKLLAPGGFVMCLLREDASTSPAGVDGASLVASFPLPDGAEVHLFRSLVEQPRKQVLFHMKRDEDFQWVDDLKATLRSSPDAEVLIVSQGDPHTGVVGFVNCLRREPGMPFIRYVAVLDPEVPQFSVDEPLYRDQLGLGLVSNVLQDGAWGSFRFLCLGEEGASAAVRTQHAHVDMARPGDLASLRDERDKLVKVFYSALNFRDIMIATGRLPEECVLGMEVSGLDERGARVMGIAPAGGLGTSVRTCFAWEVPGDWSLLEAATVPVVYATAYYSLVVRGQIRPGQSVLVHSGSGGVGQAAIAIALHMNCAVFTTVGSDEKRSFLKDRFPQLGDCNIGNSRDESFHSMVMMQTNGRGVDLVLNSLAGEKLQASVRCLAENGHFLEIGKFDMYTDKSVGLRVFLKNVTFHGINLMKVMSDDQHACDQLQGLLAKGIRSGVVKPLPATVFEWDQVEAAFRFMAAGSHIGKVLIRVASDEQPAAVLAQPRLWFAPSECVVVTGGMGGLGLELCELLVSRGARHLLVVSRKGVSTGHQALRVRSWRDAGVRLELAGPTDDVASLLQRCPGTVAAVFHLAAVLSDGMFERQTAAAFRDAWRPKWQLARDLDAATRSLRPPPRLFVAFSSAAAGRGNPGQTNYALANSAVERLIERRVADGHPGLAVQWGPVADVGLAADLTTEALDASAVEHQSVASFLDTLEGLLASGRQGVVASLVVGEGRQQPRHGDQLLDALSRALGVQDVRELPAETTLAGLGVDSLMQVEIRSAVERHCGVVLSPADMLVMTAGRLLRLAGGDEASPAPQQQQAEARRFADLLQFACSPSAAPRLPRDTVVVLGAKAEEVEGRRRRPALFLAHPVDGSADALRELAAEVDRPVVCFQFGREAPRRSLRHLAAFYLQKARELQSDGPYLLGGYSMGVVVALEMALQLHSEGVQAHVVSLDGLPTMEKLRRPHVIAHIEERYLLNAILARCPNVEPFSLECELSSMESWGGKLDRCLAALHGRLPPEQVDQLKEALEAFHWRLMACAGYERRSDVVISGDVLVVVAKEGLIQAEDSPDTCFSKVSEGRVDVVYVEGGHVSFITGKARCSTVAGHINTWLSSLQ